MASTTPAHEAVKKTVILMAPFFGAGGPMQLCLHVYADRVTQVLRPAKSAGHQDDKRRGLAALFQSKSKVARNCSGLLTEKRELSAEQPSLSVGFFDVAAGLVCLTCVRVACQDRFVSLHRKVSFLQQVVHLTRG